jgi:nuclear GTP-binding protein
MKSEVKLGKRGGFGGYNARDKSTTNRLKVYKSGGKVSRDRTGKIVKNAVFQNTLASGTVARVQPDRRWFGNTRVIGQRQLDSFRDSLQNSLIDPYKIVLRQNKLPLSLLNSKITSKRSHILEVESFESTFGKKATRKRAKLNSSTLEELVNQVAESSDKYDPSKDQLLAPVVAKDKSPDEIFKKGQSKRIWTELYKVIDSADVLIQVLDSRDPLGTRTKYIERFLKKEKPHKQLVFVLNKCDLVPTWVTAKWIRALSAEYPTLAFHASINNPFGKGSLIQLLRQLSRLHSDKKQISVGFFGYPNVGKSSIINTLRKQKVCRVAPIPGETKCWQYITLFKRIFLIDCPGVVYNSGDSETDTVLKGVVRIENLPDPADHVEAVLQRCRAEHLAKHYGVSSWTSHVDFLEQLATKTGKLRKGGEPDIHTAAKIVLHDWQRGKIPFYTLPAGEACDRTTMEASQGKMKIENQSLSAQKGLSCSLVPATSVSPPKIEEDNTGIDWDEVCASVAEPVSLTQATKRDADQPEGTEKRPRTDGEWHSKEHK